MIKIAVCDDNKDFAESVCSVLSSEYKDCCVDCYSDGAVLMKSIADKQEYDIYILDIEMPKVSGMKIARAIRDYQKNAVIIFLTGYIKYAVDSFELNIFRFIPKDEIKKRLIRAIDDALKLVDTDERFYIADNKIKLYVKDILYVKKNKNDVVFCTCKGEISEKKKSLQNVMESLKSRRFVMIERGYIANIVHIERIENNNAVISNGDVLPIGRRRMKELKETILNYWGS